MSGMKYSDLSRAVSHALRHEPWVYELELDHEGWVPVESLLTALRPMRPEWSSLLESDLSEMIQRSDKQRHELKDGKVRALYGHSIPGKLARVPDQPPAILYHGTAPETAAIIQQEGLKPMGRQYVHLSVDIPTAEQVGQRKSKTPVMLKILTEQASQTGIQFYQGNDRVWLADEVPPDCIVLNN